MEREPTFAEKLLAMSTKIAIGKDMKFHEPREAGLFLEGLLGARGEALLARIERTLAPGEEHRQALRGMCDLVTSRSTDGKLSYGVEPWQGKESAIAEQLRKASERPSRALVREIEHDRGHER
jgi:hypothetical protein